MGAETRIVTFHLLIVPVQIVFLDLKPRLSCEYIVRKTVCSHCVRCVFDHASGESADNSAMVSAANTVFFV